MPSGMENLEGSRFILRYEQPWGGIASNAAREDIAPNQLVSSDGIFIRNGRLCSTFYYPFDPNYFRYTDGAEPLYWAASGIIKAIYTVGPDVVAITDYCQTYYYDFTNFKWVIDQTLSISLPGPAHYDCSIMIGGIIYIFDYNNGVQYVYKPKTSIAEGTWFVGGKYCFTVDRYLITCNIHMNGYNYTDSNGVVQTVNPVIRADGYNWSVPSEYTTFGPVTADPVLDPNQQAGRQTGWNFLAEVQNEITGCFAMGNVGYILHDQGITQLTPTGVDTAPFTATLLWGGKDGVGLTMPETLDVYGYISVWGNNNNFYLFSTGAAPQEICGAAKRAIYRDLNMFKWPGIEYFDVHGSLINVGVDNRSPSFVYNIYIVYQTPSNPITMIVWSYVLETSTWTRTTVDITSLLQQITGNPNYNPTLPAFEDFTTKSTFKFPQTSQYSSYVTMGYVSPLYGGMIITVQRGDGSGIQDSFFLFQYINTEGVTSTSGVYPVTNLTFRSEEFQIYRKPTVRGVILRASGVGTLHVTVGTSSFTDIEVGSSPTDVKLYRSFGMYTDQAPNVNITSTNFNGYITKVHAFGTYAEGEPI
jgi:hypothetical protein